MLHVLNNNNNNTNSNDTNNSNIYVSVQEQTIMIIKYAWDIASLAIVMCARCGARILGVVVAVLVQRL